jgi:hypothetical protein
MKTNKNKKAIEQQILLRKTIKILFGFIIFIELLKLALQRYSIAAKGIKFFTSPLLSEMKRDRKEFLGSVRALIRNRPTEACTVQYVCQTTNKIQICWLQCR